MRLQTFWPREPRGRLFLGFRPGLSSSPSERACRAALGRNQGDTNCCSDERCFGQTWLRCRKPEAAASPSQKQAARDTAAAEEFKAITACSNAPS